MDNPDCFAQRGGERAVETRQRGEAGNGGKKRLPDSRKKNRSKIMKRRQTKGVLLVKCVTQHSRHVIGRERRGRKAVKEKCAL